MSALFALILADCILFLHGAIILANIAGLFVIPWGARRQWRWVRNRLWRGLHLLSWAIVAVQALAGRACFLTEWQHDLQRWAGESPSDEPLILHAVNRLIFWPLPLWVFALGYTLLAAYTISLWWLVPPSAGRRGQDHDRGTPGNTSADRK